MAASVNVTMDTRGFQKAMAKKPSSIARALKPALDRIGRDITAQMSKTRLRGRPGLIRRTGTLARSQKHVVRGNSLRNLMMIYSIGGNIAPYAAVHEYGATITAKSAPFLVFQIQPAGGGAANTGIWRKKKSVRIPPRLGFRDTWKKRVTFRRRVLRDALKRGLVKK